MEGPVLSEVAGYHRPVLLREVIEPLEVKRGSWYLDCTLGDGGHALEILKLGGNIVGIDVDPQALERAGRRFEKLGIDKSRYKLVRGNFRNLVNLIEKPASIAKRGEQTDHRISKFVGAIFDLGVSSLQLEAPQRGFSIIREGPLDMRMDPDLEVRALDLINAGGRRELFELFNRLGEEKNSYAVADALVRARSVRPIKTTKQLTELVEKVIGGRTTRIHPATKIFQALRIAVNDELNALEEGLDQVKDLIEGNGRILVISFHSLEDRIVKNTFKKWQSLGLGEILTKKPIRPRKLEIESNPKSRSAKLRVFKKI